MSNNGLDTPKATFLPDIPIDGKLRMVASRKKCIIHYGTEKCQPPNKLVGRNERII